MRRSGCVAFEERVRVSLEEKDSTTVPSSTCLAVPFLKSPLRLLIPLHLTLPSSHPHRLFFTPLCSNLDLWNTNHYASILSNSLLSIFPLFHNLFLFLVLSFSFASPSRSHPVLFFLLTPFPFRRITIPSFLFCQFLSPFSLALFFPPPPFSPSFSAGFLDSSPNLSPALGADKAYLAFEVSPPSYWHQNISYQGQGR